MVAPATHVLFATGEINWQVVLTGVQAATTAARLAQLVALPKIEAGFKGFDKYVQILGTSHVESKPLISNESPVIVAGLILCIPVKLVRGSPRTPNPPLIAVILDNGAKLVSTSSPMKDKPPFTEVIPDKPFMFAYTTERKKR